MSKLPGWLGRLGAELTELGDRLERRRDEAAGHGAGRTGLPGAGDAGPAGDVPAPAVVAADVPAGAVRVADERRGAAADHVPPPPSYAPSVAARPDPVAAIPWGMRVAAEAGWRLLVLAGTLWVLMRVISAVQLVVLAFVAALLVTAMLQPTVARLRGYGLPRGLATAVTAVLGFVIMGLVGWFVVWQVMDNIDTLSDKVRDGIEELKRWLLDSPFHVTEQQINDIAKNLSDTIGTNTEQITSAGLEGVTVMVEVLTGILLAMFSTLFLLYDGRRIWHWVLKLVPAQARPGVAGAGPRAWRTLTAYVRGTVIVALIDAIFIGLGIFFLDVPMAVPLAVFIFLFAFIPLVGAVISGALAVVVALVTEGVFTALMVLAVVLAVQQIEGHVLQPFILGRAVRVHPLAVVLSVAAGGMIAGIGGAVVAVPLVAVTNTVVGYLRTYGQEQALRYAPSPRGATAVDVAPTPAPGSTPENSDRGDDEDGAGGGTKGSS
ncbi:AI-2E family transporter [Streptomyces sp. NBC_00257]|uniref:AI-2E family transporter n=1 Tax=unclassified Streptomyces TaxID=2593676 RepID=UPI0022525F19|nr:MULTISPECIES: AI-2E family transporter [unclassified Streptomyces]WTB56486.1 AI-2E family transporter [Streptomyces sp. NBC_00826]WTH90631.1 AI-2E family transporter [Streptomyces sp. NBC_00825]WTH99357.1 AI-2E family transporter [Streptomyces sp. NBC_00822]MCX4864791.1 AI-2E family transporter [Streptomyces sp. NBC_00906]MCX4896029.1 AI-2E family transporter [Streptomyces sp. NBC_00892]